MFENFPYTNFHELNLDWIISKIKNMEDFAVLSVNGMTGDVILYTDPDVEFPEIDSPEWKIVRTANGTNVGIMFQNDKVYLKYGETLSEVYSDANPPAFPVTSVNGQTGAVVTFPEAAVRLPDVNDQYTNIRRQIDSSGTPAIVGIEVDKTKAVRMNGTQRKKIYDEDNPPPYPVTSVNNQTGDIIIAVPIEPLSINQPLWQASENSSNHTAGFSRFTLDGNVSIYLTSDSSKVEAYIDYLSEDEQTSYTRKLLTTDDIPSGAGVVSINGMNGVVTLYGTNIELNSGDSRDLDTIISGLESSVPGIGESVAWYEPGNNASQNIRQGEYVIWKDVAYIATSNIFAGDPLSGSVLSALTGGISNNIFNQSTSVISPVTGVSTVSFGDIYKIGPVILIPRLTILCTSSPGNSWQTIGTIPVGFRPASTMTFPVVDDDSMDSSTGTGVVSEMRIANDGNVQVWYPKAGLHYWGGGICYI